MELIILTLPLLVECYVVMMVIMVVGCCIAVLHVGLFNVYVYMTSHYLGP